MTSRISSDPYVNWLQILAGLLNPAFPGDLEEALNVVLPHLRVEVSAQYLTAESARRVARAERFGPVPDWGVMSKTLSAYIREVRPAAFGLLPAPREPDFPKPSADEIRRVDSILDDFFASRPPLRRSLGAT